MKFLDRAKIFIKSGDGGDGCVSFRREKFIPMGGPDGGNGGDGGDIIIHVTPDLNTLIDFRYQQHFKAAKGEGGKGKNRTGKKGKSLTLRLPPGTQIWNDDETVLLKDITTSQEDFILLKGGQGGLGNQHFKSSVQKAPRFSQKGFPGEDMWVWLQLKLIADVGLIGLPNAGKSTMISLFSRAGPKIAPYPFTTLIPHLGTVTWKEKRFVMADIPGLVKDAHAGKGLGHRFLGHIERSFLLVHLVSAESDDVVQDYEIIQHELKQYDQTLWERKQILVLSKADTQDPLLLGKKKAQLETYTQKEVFVVSCITPSGTTELLDRITEDIP